MKRKLIPYALVRGCRLGSLLLASLLSLGTSQAEEVRKEAEDVDDMHARLFVEDMYPSAARCQRCHPNQYREWSVSPHAYAMVSPVFNTMQAKLIQETNGTLGDFCIRCHTPAGMNLGEPLVTAYANRHPVSQEGVTCIACHRVSKAYGKVSGRRGLDQGPITEPVKGPSGDRDVVRALVQSGDVTQDPDGMGRKIHQVPESFFQLADASFCAACHDVTGPDGFRLEEAFSHYNASPAAKAGVSCQDCHMGQAPGRYTGDDKSNYAFGPAARVNGEWTRERRLSNHMIVGPDQSMVHPGIFPQTRNALYQGGNSRGLASVDEWLQFDVEAGWGSDAFENQLPQDIEFPEAWANAADRQRARILVDANLALIAEYKKDRLALLRHGYQLSEILLEPSGPQDLRFKLEVSNGTDGHSVPTGFDAERLVWLHVSVSDRDGERLFRSGDLDPNGDLRNLHSSHVRDRSVELDRQLFSLQGKFLTRNLRGGEREQVLPINHSLSPLPFVRPPRRSNVLFGEPYEVRKHRQSISPLGSRWARYHVPGRVLNGKVPYTVKAELKIGMLPVNLLLAIQDMGFDYGLSAKEVGKALVDSYDVLWAREIIVDATGE